MLFIYSVNNGSEEGVCVREYRKNKKKAFYVHSNVSNIILRNSLFRLMREHSLEVGQTLHLLYQINRIGEMRNECFGFDGNLYEIFVQKFMSEVYKFHVALKLDYLNNNNNVVVEESESDDHLSLTIENNGKIQQTEKDLLHSLTTDDDFLLLAFALNTPNALNEEKSKEIKGEEQQQQKSSPIPNSREIYEELQKNQICILPFEQIIINSLENILRRRISFANAFAIQLYRDEFGLLKHLQYIRKILLMEASDLMYQFYMKIFQQVNLWWEGGF